ncbi:hypothetical protein GLW08_13875 [Pontibacillus yanchengensis]|uniref:Uncharacterized protein n=2 Tax=Pontibacillus yanchengensis TaxID=462910 RepID=A0ACC7VG34_9BACI|nr:hypothetical protein [Pontibacillus yanchengensis]MYL34551.1 hypothetical protein [Pontibacillus yanchengensis]MYL54418.1 hypothetical protein [Pontibacillus yanchengensis]
MKKNLFYALLLSMVLVLGACSGGSEGEEDSDSNEDMKQQEDLGVSEEGSESEDGSESE